MTRAFTSRTWLAVAALIVVSLLGDLFCRTLANGSVDREKLLQSAGERIGGLPTRIGPWQMARLDPLSDDVLRMLHCRAHESRVYVDDQTGETVSLILMTGTAGPLVAHTPEVCYSSVDFDTVEPTEPVSFEHAGGGKDVFNQVTFSARTIAAERQRVFYAWRNAQGHWLAPKSPRMTLGGQPMLYKLQLAATIPHDSPQGRPASDPGRRFLADLLPVLETSLDIP